MNHNEIELESFAKINLHLDVKGKYENGFHELYSVFQLIDLSDTLKINITSKTEKKISNNEKIIINGNFSCKTEDNLIYKIINDFEKKADLSFCCQVDVEKRIPDGAGLGGGSSNAAYVLYYLNKMNGSPLNEEDLVDIAEKNGSDLPFFLKAVTAVVEGRGEKIKAVQADLSKYSLVVVCPDFKISTKEAYSLYDRHDRVYKSLNIEDSEVVEILEKKPSEWGFFNSFTPLLTDKEKVYKEIFKIFKDFDCEYFNITGSGSAVFGIFNSKSDALKAEEIFKTNYPFVWNGKMLAGKPLLDK